MSSAHEYYTHITYQVYNTRYVNKPVRVQSVRTYIYTQQSLYELVPATIEVFTASHLCRFVFWKVKHEIGMVVLHDKMKKLPIFLDLFWFLRHFVVFLFLICSPTLILRHSRREKKRKKTPTKFLILLWRTTVRNFIFLPSKTKVHNVSPWMISPPRRVVKWYPHLVGLLKNSKSSTPLCTVPAR